MRTHLSFDGFLVRHAGVYNGKGVSSLHGRLVNPKGNYADAARWKDLADLQAERLKDRGAEALVEALQLIYKTHGMHWQPIEQYCVQAVIAKHGKPK